MIVSPPEYRLDTAKTEDIEIVLHGSIDIKN